MLEINLKIIVFIIIAFGLAPLSHASTPQEVAAKAMEGYRLFTRDSLPSDRADGYTMMLDAAWEGDAKAANNIGWLMEQGIFVKKDLQGALRWYERAADQLLPAAALNYVGLVFRHPEALEGKSPDIKRVADAAYTAGTALAMGRGLHYDYRQGEDLLMRAALLGNEDAALTIAQQLEMYPDSFSYLPLEKILQECDALLPETRRNLPSGSVPETFIGNLLTPTFWYDRIPDKPANKLTNNN